MKTFFIFFFVTLLTFSLHAQETIDILSLSYRYGLPQEYKETYSDKASETGMINSFQAGFNIAENTMLAFNLNHFYFNVKDDPVMPDGIASPININGIILRAGIIQKVGDNGNLSILVAPRLMSDFKNVDGNSFQFGGIVSYQKTFSEEFKFGFGAMYNQELFGPYLVPLFPLSWKINDKWLIWGMVPVTARVEYKVNDGLTAGFNHFGLITSYYMGDEEYAGDYMERQSIDLSLFLRQRLFGNIYVEGMAGRTFGRAYNQYAGDQKVDFAIPLVAFGDDRTARNVTTFNDGMIFTVKLIYNIPRPE